MTYAGVGKLIFGGVELTFLINECMESRGIFPPLYTPGWTFIPGIKLVCVDYPHLVE